MENISIRPTSCKWAGTICLVLNSHAPAIDNEHETNLHSTDDRLLDQDPLEDTDHALTHAPDLARGTGTVTETGTEDQTEELDSHRHLYTLTSEWVKVETVQEVNNRLEDP